MAVLQQVLQRALHRLHGIDARRQFVHVLLRDVFDLRAGAIAVAVGVMMRAVLNFPISGMRPYPAFVWSMVAIKRSAAVVNHGLGLLDEQRAHVIVQAADEALAGVLNEHFVVDPFQAQTYH